MRVYVGRGRDNLYMISRKPFDKCTNPYGDTYLTSEDLDGEVLVCPRVWHQLGGPRLRVNQSRSYNLTLNIEEIT